MGTSSVNPRWSAPELVRETASVSTYSDVWSFGMLCLEVLTGELPYATIKKDYTVMQKVGDGEPPDHPGRVAEQNGLSKQMWTVMQKCWNRKPEARFSMTEVKHALLGIRGLMKLPPLGMWDYYKLSTCILSD